MGKSKSPIKIDVSGLCACGSGNSYVDCCGRYISNQQPAPDAQALMRSRYTAYTLDDQEYIQRTWHSDTRPPIVSMQESRCHWLGLTVMSYHPAAQTATVEFVAKYKSNGRAHRLHEISNFVCVDGEWFYLDGQFPLTIDNA